MYRIAATAAICVIGATAVWAQNADAIKQRRDAMSTVAKASGANFKMVKGDSPFDLAVVQAGLKTFQEVMPKFKGLFPDDSRKGETDATAKIWEARAAFEQAIDKFVADSKVAAAGITDEASFKKLYPAVSANCGGCHKEQDGFAPKVGDSLKKMQR